LLYARWQVFPGNWNKSKTGVKACQRLSQTLQVEWLSSLLNQMLNQMATQTPTSKFWFNDHTAQFLGIQKVSQLATGNNLACLLNHPKLGPA
jgi:hypothetical protein